MNKLLKFGILLNTKSLVAQSVFSCFVLATVKKLGRNSYKLSSQYKFDFYRLKKYGTLGW